ncbi:DUF3570 domain-containing protein [uncultured Flavobacterium sp.]|uniref:DUF3570 domain-containing protein n=1 Tax=uncultured Flavobacterium sp. TaxID=165435 RepID=UPI0025F988DA|nr:DUF3570 domain-containing protein [uncultured Flavobacterium sp.]
MGKHFLPFALFFIITTFAQENDSIPVTDSTEVVFKKRVLETTEIDILSSYYKQQGVHSAVGGGTGTEELTDTTADIIVAIPLNDDDVLTVDAGFSAYTSASSGNINPFFGGYNSGTGASRRMARRDDDDDDDDDEYGASTPYGSPWVASTGASRKDVLTSLSATFSHSSDDRNTVWTANASGSVEYDYHSIGFGAGLAKLFNDKNTEVSVKASAYLDKWQPIYPTELHEYSLYGLNFQNSGYFDGVPVLDQFGQETESYLPTAFKPFSDSKRNSYALSFGFSQVLTRKLQASVFLDVLFQNGLLSTPYQRVYFADRANYYIGKPQYIPVYASSENRGVFKLADDVERLPGNRFKIPIGLRLNYYANDFLVVRTYYRFYTDDWGLKSHTASIELPVKLGQRFTIYPMYRFYTQSASDYFAPHDRHYSFEKYYTSDYDLSSFDSHQYGGGFSYTDIFQSFRILYFGFKSADIRFSRYERSDSLSASIISIALKFVQ